METNQLIAADKFCTFYNVDLTFVKSLTEIGLLETIMVRETQFIHIPELGKIERMLRLHDDLDINAEGIDAVHRLLDQIEQMRLEIINLKNRLQFYETRI